MPRFELEYQPSKGQMLDQTTSHSLMELVGFEPTIFRLSVERLNHLGHNSINRGDRTRTCDIRLIWLVFIAVRIFIKMSFTSFYQSELHPENDKGEIRTLVPQGHRISSPAELATYLTLSFFSYLSEGLK